MAGVVVGGEAKLLEVGGVEIRVKFWMDDMGKMWWTGGVVGEVGTATATRLVRGQAVKRVPSMLGRDEWVV